VQARRLLPYQRYLLYRSSAASLLPGFLLSNTDSKSLLSDSVSCGHDVCGDTNTSATDSEQCSVSKEHLLSPFNESHCLMPLNTSKIFSSHRKSPSTVSSLADGRSVVLDKFDSESLNKEVNVKVGEISSESSLSTTVMSSLSTDMSSHTNQLSTDNRKRVSEFFSHSRLHHISMWGAECKAYVANLQAQVTSIFT
jgi:hypothetical protein